MDCFPWKILKVQKRLGTDLHLVRPEHYSINCSRSSLNFDFGGEKQGEAPDTFYDKDYWKPKGEVKEILQYGCLL
ncbi:hypothetical protein CJ306_29920 (plasmid) [Bacillus cereus]|nr:hypothetical protein CJ306_29920 [Bacillus cereus]